MADPTVAPAKAPEKPKEVDVILDRVLKALQDQTGMTNTEIAEIDLDVNFAEHLHFDELDRIELVMHIEEEMGIDISDAEEESATTLRVLVSIVKAKKPK